MSYSLLCTRAHSDTCGIDIYVLLCTIYVWNSLLSKYVPCFFFHARWSPLSLLWYEDDTTGKKRTQQRPNIYSIRSNYRSSAVALMATKFFHWNEENLPHYYG